MPDGKYIGSELEVFQYAHNWKQYYAKFISPHLKGEVLEIGAGIGGTTKLLCDGSQNKWCCLEPDTEMAATIQKRIATGELPGCCEVWNGYSSDLIGREQFDVLLYIDVLEHIQEDRGELINACALLKHGGHIIVLVPAHQWLYNSFDKAIGHYRRYSRKGLVSIVPDCLQLKSVRYLDSIGLLASLGNSLILKEGNPRKAQVLLWDKVFIPMSRVVDSLINFSFGKSILGIWEYTCPVKAVS